MSEKKPFWGTIPGILTGTATVITAGLGLMSALNGGGNDAAQPSASVSSPSPSVSASGTSTLSPEPLTDELPEAQVIPQSLDFDDLGVGRSTTKTITVVNSGDATLDVSNAEVEGPGAGSFVVAQDGCSDTPLDAGARCELTIEFRPASTGSFSADVVIDHNAQSTPTQVPVGGKGVLLQL